MFCFYWFIFILIIIGDIVYLEKILFFIYCIICSLIGVLIFVIIFGNVGVLINEMDVVRNDF